MYRADDRQVREEIAPCNGIPQRQNTFDIQFQDSMRVRIIAGGRTDADGTMQIGIPLTPGHTKQGDVYEWLGGGAYQKEL